MGTVIQAIEDAMRELVVLGEGETATADQINDGKRKLVAMLNQWSVEGMMVPFLTKETFALSSTTASYTWGSGQQFNSQAPIEVVAATYLIATTQKPLKALDATAYMRLPLTGIVSEPSGFWYDRQTTPKFYLDVAPYTGSVIVLSKKALDADFELTDQIVLPDEYELAIFTNLAIVLAPGYQRPVSTELAYNAKMSKRVVRRRNVKVPSMLTDVPVQRRPMLPLRTG
jgi:hypothetical protein